MDAPAAPELQESLLAEQAQRAEDGVRVDAEHGSEVTGSWQAFSGLCFPIGNRTADPGGQS